MPEVKVIGKQEALGVGKPDFSREIFHISRGETPRLMEPRLEEKQKVFVLFLPEADPLLVGETRHLIDLETFLDLPYTVPPDYTWELREWMGSLNGIVEDVGSATMDGIPVLAIPIYPFPDYCTHEYEQIIAFASTFYDPLAEHDWVFDYTVKNLDTIPIKGVIQISLMLHAVGTAEMTEKTVKCKWCGHEFKVPLKQTIIDCPRCSRRFVVPFYGRSPVV